VSLSDSNVSDCFGDRLAAPEAAEIEMNIHDSMNEGNKNVNIPNIGHEARILVPMNNLCLLSLLMQPRPITKCNDSSPIFFFNPPFFKR